MLSDNPTKFQGDAFNEEKALEEMNSNASKMAVRDVSSMRLKLAFIFWDEECMEQMLERLRDYPLADIFISRLHIRSCFTGLAAFAMHKRNGSESLLKLGQDVSLEMHQELSFTFKCMHPKLPLYVHYNYSV